MPTAQSTYAKILAAHHVYTDETRGDALYIDRHFLEHDTSPQAFDGLRLSKRDVRHPDKNFAPHPDTAAPNPIIAKLRDTLDGNAYDFQLARFAAADFGDGLVQPGMVIAGAPDTIGGLGACGVLALPVTAAATVEHILATQTAMIKNRPPLLRVDIPADAVRLSLEEILAQIVPAAGTARADYVVEFYGAGLAQMDMTMRHGLARRTQKICHAAIVAPDDILFEYLRGKEFSPGGRDWSFAQEYWEKMMPDADAACDHHIRLSANGAAVA